MNMKFLAAIVGFAALAAATPTPTVEDVPAGVLEKRASISEAATLGYATQNGG
jgi:pectate lyase